MAEFNMRWMIRRDLVQVEAVERVSWGNPLVGDELEGSLRPRNRIGVVLEDRATERVVGWMLYELERGQLVLHRLAVDPSYRRRGLGRCLAQRLQDKLESHKRVRVVADVDERNVDGVRFLRACGWEVVDYSRDAGCWVLAGYREVGAELGAAAG